MITDIQVQRIIELHSKFNIIITYSNQVFEFELTYYPEFEMVTISPVLNMHNDNYARFAALNNYRDEKQGLYRTIVDKLPFGSSIRYINDFRS